jgi:hypothetical protein
VRRALLLADVLGIIGGLTVTMLLDTTSGWYALMWSFRLDLSLLFRTTAPIMRRDRAC